MTVVIDASVALKWVVEEAGSESARRLVRDETLAAPELMLIECANVLWVKARRRQISQSDASAAFAAIEAVPIRTIPGRAHVAAAQAIAFELDQTAYDSLYLAVALAEHAILITADEVFAQSAMMHPVYRSNIKTLDGA